MIGVLAHPSDRAVATEFFELFKTPWEFYRPHQPYEVLLCVGQDPPPHDAGVRLIVVYSSHKLRSDGTDDVVEAAAKCEGLLIYREEDRFPLYGNSLTFLRSESALLFDLNSRRAIAYLDNSSGRVIARFGYDLFHEVRVLLTAGQPVCNASYPTLDLHIAMLRDTITSSGVPVVEIPPVPQGYRFIACLTHDVDHPQIRRHVFDRTTFGFLYRAVFGGVVDVLRGRVDLRQLRKNYGAALKLPFVYLGLARDFWDDLGCYPEIEGHGRSSFFVIPFKNDAGWSSGGPAPSRRAARYGAADIAITIQHLISVGCEIGLHGVDAWCDTVKGRDELDEIRRIAGTQQVGTRMHWLYFNQHTPSVLEQAGAHYDSTIGYNEAVGYRAGTSQVYKPIGAERLLELPLHIMDTALFFPSRLGLSPVQARQRVSVILDHAEKVGGTVTLNWHDRSIAPERCWGEFYVDTINELKQRGAWLATAADTVAWFRKRRQASPKTGFCQTGAVHPTETLAGEDLPGLQLQVHRGRGASKSLPVLSMPTHAGQGSSTSNA